MTNHEADSQDLMIRWLERQTPDVRHYVVRFLNWDNCERVLKWIATQKNTDIATAKAIFWGCDPVGLLARSPTAPTNSYATLARLVCEQAVAGCYPKSGLADSIENFANQSQRLQSAYTSRRMPPPFTPPADFFELHDGRGPQVPRSLRMENNAELRRLLWNLGTNVAAPFDVSTPENENRRNMMKGLLWLGGAIVLSAGALLAKCSDHKPEQVAP